MALNLISLEEAARILSVSVEQLNLMRERRELHGYRDGALWKFKRQDIERLASERAPAADGASEESIEFLSLPLDIEDDDSSIDAVLLSERELGESEPGTSSTVIGRPGGPGSSESDIRLIAHDEPSSGVIGGSDVKLVPAKEDRTPGSDVKLVAQSPATPPVEADEAFDFNLDDDDSELSIEIGDGDQASVHSAEASPSPADGGSASRISLGGGLDGGSSLIGGSALDLPAPNIKGGGTISLGSGIGRSMGSDLALGGSDVSIGVPPGSDIAAGAPPRKSGSDVTLAPPTKPGSDVALGGPIEDDSLSLVDSNFDFDDGSEADQVSDSSIDLDAERQEPVRGGSSDVTRRAADSGISLASPSDSGLSLEEPLELSGLGEEPFQLGEDPLLGLADDSDSNEVANLKSDDDFLLTPLEEGRDADSDDSGSQVIALDTDSSFDAPVGAMLGSDEDALVPAGGALGAGGLGAAPAMAPGGAPAFASREPQYSVWNVVALGTCLLFLTMSGMMAYDLMRNMWSWRGNYTVNSPLMDFISSWVS